MVFMFIVSLSAMAFEMQRYWGERHLLLMAIAASIFTLSAWLAVEAYLRLRRDTLAAAQRPAATGD